MEHLTKEQLQQLVPEAYQSYVQPDGTPLIRYKDIVFLLEENAYHKSYHPDQVIGYNPFSNGYVSEERLKLLSRQDKPTWIDINRDSLIAEIREVPIHVQIAIHDNAFFMTLEECMLAAGLVSKVLSFDDDGHHRRHPLEDYAPYRCLSPTEFTTCQILHKYSFAHYKKGMLETMSWKNNDLHTLYTLLHVTNTKLTGADWERLELTLLRKNHLKIEVIYGKQGEA